MAILPFTLIVWTYITFSFSYILAISRGDVDVFFPYISDTGARKPESSIFGQMLNISACLALLTLYVRYKQVEGYVDDVKIEHTETVEKLNKFSMIVAVFVCLGLSIVANFQETSVIIVHFIGAIMTFGLGTVYELIQAYITHKMHPEINGKGVFVARLVIAILSACFFITCTVSGALVKMVDRDGKINIHWDPSDPAYYIHLTSTISEWCLAATFLSFFFTFLKEFQFISLHTTTRLHRHNLYNSDQNLAIPHESDA